MNDLVFIILQNVQHLDPGLDGAPGLFLMVLFTIGTLLITLGLVISILLIIGAFLSLISFLGLLSISVTYGLYYHSFVSGFNIFIYSISCIVSIITSNIIFYVVHLYYQFFSVPLIHVMASLIGVLIGYGIGYLITRIVKKYTTSIVRFN